MGYPYHELIPAAILLDNPGILREGFVRLLSEIPCNRLCAYSSKDPWEIKDETDNTDFDNGLEGLARILGLEKSQEYAEFMKPSFDENGIKISLPYLDVPLDEDVGYKYRIAIHEKNVLGTSRIVSELSWNKLCVGSLWKEVMMGLEEGLVTKIIEEKLLNGEGVEDASVPGFEYKMEIISFERKGRVELYRTDEDLLEAWPQFHPDFIYDWNQERGQFMVLGNLDNFRWVMKNGKYYLDSETFNRIQASFIGYVDLILSSEAIKRKAWKLLSYKGRVHLPQFLRDFPDAKEVYDRAVWDSHTSLYAKQKGMTNNDLLRMRSRNFRSKG